MEYSNDNKLNQTSVENQGQNFPSLPPQNSNHNLKIIIGILIVLLVATISIASFYILRTSNFFEKEQQINDSIYQKEQELDLEESTIPDGWVEYKNIEFGFAFAYPKKYGGVEVNPAYGTEGKYGRLIQFTFTTLCDTCEPGKTNTWTIDLNSPGIIEMGGANHTFGGVGTSRPIAGLPWGAGYVQTSDRTVSPKWSPPPYWQEKDRIKARYPVFRGKNVEGLLIQLEDEFHNLYRTSVVFNLKHQEITGFEFMTHDKIGKNNNTENLKSVAKTFRLLD